MSKNSEILSRKQQFLSQNSLFQLINFFVIFDSRTFNFGFVQFLSQNSLFLLIILFVIFDSRTLNFDFVFSRYYLHT